MTALVDASAVHLESILTTRHRTAEAAERVLRDAVGGRWEVQRGPGGCVVTPPPGTAVADHTLHHLQVWLELHDEVDRLRADLGDYQDESDVVGELARQVMSVRDLDQVLLTITTQTLRLSESDICGIFLREETVLRMRSCVGHRLVETSRLVIGPGQGVAGQVLQTGEPARIDSYLQDTSISSDFVALAEQEETRAALAVPLRLGDVWSASWRCGVAGRRASPNGTCGG